MRRWYTTAQRLEGAAILEELLHAAWPRVHRGILMARLTRELPWIASRLWRLREAPGSASMPPTTLYASPRLGELVWSWEEDGELEAILIDGAGRRTLIRHGLELVRLLEELHIDAIKNAEGASVPPLALLRADPAEKRVIVQPV